VAINLAKLLMSQSSLKRVLVSEPPTASRRRAKPPRVAILFEASPGFGVDDFIRAVQAAVVVAILFEASPGFGGL